MQYPLIDIVTVTGHRQEAFNLCEMWYEKQTYPKDKINWIVVNDDNGKTKCTKNQTKINSPLLWKKGYNTQRINWMYAFAPLIESKAEYVFCWEDDDYYSSTYLEEYVYLLQKFDLVGEGNAKYYYIPMHVYKEIHNYEHTSLAALAFSKKILPLFEKALHSGEPFFDLKFWQYAKEESVNSLIFANKNLSVGIKGIPGRPGIGLGHRPDGWESDPFGKKLMEWIPTDWESYKQYINNGRK